MMDVPEEVLTPVLPESGALKNEPLDSAQGYDWNV